MNTLIARYVIAVLLLVATLTDLRNRIIPDWVSAAVLSVGMLCCLMGQRQFGALLFDTVFMLVMLLIVVLPVEHLTNQCGMGGGDIKLLAALAGTMGLLPLLVLVILSHIMALVAMVITKIVKRSAWSAVTPIPMAPFFFMAYFFIF